MMTVQISAKKLGALALRDHCPRCAWIQLRQKRLPWQGFPGIFSSIDCWSKRLTHRSFAAGRTPPWLKGLGEVVELLDVPHWSQFRLHDSASGVDLTGVPDEMLRLIDGSVVIIDYKTARYTNGQDRLLPLYEVQLNAYRLIAERLGMGTVSAVALVYFEPRTEVTPQMPAQMTSDGASMPFATRRVTLPLYQPQEIHELLSEVRRLSDLPSPPDRRDGCGDCEALDGVVAMLRR